MGEPGDYRARAQDEKDLSIIVVNWNTCNLLACCLESIEKISFSGNLEVWVVDNGSSDGSPAMVRGRFPGVRLVENSENIGFAAANNLAIGQSRGRYCLLLNSDTELAAGVLSDMVAFLDANPTAGIVGVRLAFPDGSPQFCYGGFPSLWTEFRSLFGLHRWDLSCWHTLDAPRPVDWVSGACLLVRRQTLKEIGLLDEGFFMFGEEVDLCYRATLAGWDVMLVPSLPVIHVRAGSSGKTSSRIMRLYRGRLRYARKHLGRSRSAILLGMILLSTLGKWLWYSARALVQSRFGPSRRLWTEVVTSVWKGELSGGI